MSATRYPIYVISKGRWEPRQTTRVLAYSCIPHHVVVEPQEYDAYAAVIPPSRLIVTPFSNLGQGSIPVRNFVWEHSIAAGHARHWVLDDNIRLLARFNRNRQRVVESAGIFQAAEDFVDRYENVRLAGFNYTAFVQQSRWQPPYYLNTRIYSCILIDNSLPFRWRGRYNEDTDLSLRVLKAGDCTILFNAFAIQKVPTMTLKGGNTDELYRDDGRLKMAESLVEQHPDVTTITWKWGRPQHLVDYRPFAKNQLRLRPGVVVPDGVNEYGMQLVRAERRAG